MRCTGSNVAKGWFDKPVEGTAKEAMALLVTEIVEADDSVEAEGLIGGREARVQHTVGASRHLHPPGGRRLRFSLNLGVIKDAYQFSYEPLRFTTFHEATRRLVRPW